MAHIGDKGVAFIHRDIPQDTNSFQGFTVFTIFIYFTDFLQPDIFFREITATETQA